MGCGLCLRWLVIRNKASNCCSVTDLGIYRQSGNVRVPDVVARRMIARVLFKPGAGVQAANWLVQDLPERSIVASIRELGRCDHQTLRGKVVYEQLLDRIRSRGSRSAVGATVAVKDPKVAPRYHVEIEVRQDLGAFICWQVVDVVPRTK